MTSLVSHVEQCLIKTDNLESKVDEYILNMEGMSGAKTRHFYNNICNMEDARYLEIGTWKGSSICSAMCGNNMTCVAIDNWSEWGGLRTKNTFLKNFEKYKGVNNATFIEKDCWKVNVDELDKFNIYMYDGNHSKESQFKALNYYNKCLDNEFIFMVDDWNHPPVREGTTEAIQRNNFEILFKKEIFTRSNSCKNPWHNGISIFVLKKPQ